MGTPLANSDLAIDLQHVAKTYRGKVQALRGIEMRVRRGEIFGLLGPNGAGKSTLVKIMMTVVRPTKAVGTILNQPIAHKPTLRKLGYLPEHHRFPRYLTGRQVLDFFAALSGVHRAQRRRKASELLELVGMAADADRRVSTYSKGMMQRVGLAQALVNDPELVVLDEPTDGVDPLGRRDIRNILERLRTEGKTVFINSHLLSELELIADRVAILFAGQVVKQGTIEELSIDQQRYEIEVAADSTSLGQVTAAMFAAMEQAFGKPKITPLPASPGTPLGATLQFPTGAAIEHRGTIVRITSTSPEDAQPWIDVFRRANLPIRRVQPVRPSLEDLFISIVDQSNTPGSSK